MKKKIFLLGISAFLLCGCGKIPTLTNGDEAVVTFKDGEKISANDFYNEIKDSFGLDTLINMIDKHIFETEFKDKLADAKTYAEAAVKSFKLQYDDEATALQTLQSYYGYQTFEAYENTLYLSYLQNHAIKNYVENNITEDELKEYYENDVYPDMTISHILITPEVDKDATEDEIKKAEDVAKKEIESIIKELNQAKKDGKDITESFKALADAKSDDDNVDLGEINIGSLGSEYDELIISAAELKDGEYSTKVITTELGYHVILKTKTGKKATYEDSIDSMKENIANDKLSKEQSLMIDAIRHYRDKYELDIIDSEIDSQYSKFMNNLINYYKNN
ncbi:MAG: hypothetical protein E7163_00540 [Firmicutes bacterium]|nr:hypothetical protein [Bacillota bacterium]